MDKEKLFLLAYEARKQAYAPYSGYAVGAALQCADGTVYTGCNIENSALTPTVCAERVAIFKAVSEGKMGFVGMAVAGGKVTENPVDCTPCGVCRQTLLEFCQPDFKLFLLENGKLCERSLNELIPYGFKL